MALRNGSPASDPDAGGAALVAARFPPPLPVMVPAGAPAAGDQDLAARQRALAAVEGDTIVPLVRSLIDGSTDVRVLLRRPSA